MIACLFFTWIFHFIATIQSTHGNMSPKNKHLLIIDCHNFHLMIDVVQTIRRMGMDLITLPLDTFHMIGQWKTLLRKGYVPCDNLGWTFDQLLRCSILWFNASYTLPQHEDHNGKRKAKRARVDNSDLHLIELPWVYKPMLCSLLVLWVLSSWNFAKVLAHKWEGHSMWWKWPLWSSSKCSSPSP